MSSYNRVGFCAIRQGVKRPAVKIFQSICEQIGIDVGGVDGIAGPKTDKAIRQLQEKYGLEVDGECGKDTWTQIFRDNPDVRIEALDFAHEVICFSEVSSAANAYGYAEDDIGDGAGANYGVMQHNAYGSMALLLRRAEKTALLSSYENTNKKVINEDVKAWMGSGEGVEAQNNYFRDIIITKAKSEADLLEYEVQDKILNIRLIGMYCDTMVQNGTMYSTMRAPFTEGTGGDPELALGAQWNELFRSYCSFDYMKSIWKDAFEANNEIKDGEKRLASTNLQTVKNLIHLIPDDELKMQLIAQYRARTSSPQWWRVVLKRRNLFATGEGVVNDVPANLEKDYSINFVK